MEPTEQQQPEQQQDDNLIQKLIEGILNKLDLAGKRVLGDDLFQAFLSGAQSDLTLLVAEVNRSLNAEADAYNVLADDYEGLQTENIVIHARLKDVDHELALMQNQCFDIIQQTKEIGLAAQAETQAALDEMSIDRAKWKGMYEIQQDKMLTLLSDFRQVKNDLKDLRAMEPEKLKKRLAEAREKNTTLTNEKKTLSADNCRLQLELIAMKKRYAKSEARNAYLNEGVDYLTRRMTLGDGEMLLAKQVFVSPKYDDIEFFLHVFNYELNIPIRAAKSFDDIRYINNLDCHMMARCNRGYGMTYSITELGVPICDVPAELKDHWPENMDQTVEDYFMDRIETFNPKLHERCMWARELSVMELIELPEEVRLNLVAGGLADLAHLNSKFKYELCKLEGITEADANQIREVCRAYITRWDRDNGAPHLDKAPFAEQCADRQAKELKKEKEILEQIRQGTYDFGADDRAEESVEVAA